MDLSWLRFFRWVQHFLSQSLVGIGFGILGWFLLLAGAPTAGVIIAEAVRRVTRKRRSRPLFITVAAGVVAGALPIILCQLLANGSLYRILFQALYLVLVVPLFFTDFLESKCPDEPITF